MEIECQIPLGIFLAYQPHCFGEMLSNLGSTTPYIISSQVHKGLTYKVQNCCLGWQSPTQMGCGMTEVILGGTKSHVYLIMRDAA